MELDRRELVDNELSAPVEAKEASEVVEPAVTVEILKRQSLKKIEIMDTKSVERLASEKGMASISYPTPEKRYKWKFLKSMAFTAGLVLYCIHFMMFTQAVLIEHKPWREYSTRMVQKYFPESFRNAWIIFLDCTEIIQNFLQLVSPRFPLVKIPQKNIIVQAIKMIVEWIFEWYGYVSQAIKF